MKLLSPGHNMIDDNGAVTPRSQTSSSSTTEISRFIRAYFISLFITLSLLLASVACLAPSRRLHTTSSLISQGQRPTFVDALIISTPLRFSVASPSEHRPRLITRSALPSPTPSLWGKIKGVVKKVEHAAGSAVKSAGHAAATGIKATARTAKTVADKTGVTKVAKTVAKPLAKAGHYVANTGVGKFVGKYGKQLMKYGGKGMEYILQGASTVASFVPLGGLEAAVSVPLQAAAEGAGMVGAMGSAKKGQSMAQAAGQYVKSEAKNGGLESIALAAVPGGGLAADAGKLAKAGDATLQVAKHVV